MILTPQHCTLYQQTYESSFTFDDVELEHIIVSNDDPKDFTTNTYRNILEKQNVKEKKFFSIPVMVGSKYCTSSHFKDIISDDNPSQ